jgi:hypothetical protein
MPAIGQRAETISLWLCLALARILLRTGRASLGHRRSRRGRNLVVSECIAIHVAITATGLG